MNKEETGMWVRVKRSKNNQYFHKFYKQLTKNTIGCDIDSDDYYVIIQVDNISKASFNIIDLIQVGDYVNGYKVSDIRKDIIYCCEDDFEDYCIKIDKKNIKSIVTKEQFESMKYEVK